MAGAASKTMVQIPQLNIQQMDITLVGDSPLICHAWSKKAKDSMLAKQTKQAKSAKEAKDPWMDYVQSLHWLTSMPERPTEEDVRKAKFGFPVVGFKSAAVAACSHVDGVTKVLARGVFFIPGEMVEIQSAEPPIMREDMVRVGMGTADIRYRGEFREWSATLPVRFNADVCSPSQIVNLFNVAGFAIGVGEWRPQRDGQYGMFHVQAG
jgi:hypothetical protein